MIIDFTCNKLGFGWIGIPHTRVDRPFCNGTIKRMEMAIGDMHGRSEHQFIGAVQLFINYRPVRSMSWDGGSGIGTSVVSIRRMHEALWSGKTVTLEIETKIDRPRLAGPVDSQHE